MPDSGREVVKRQRESIAAVKKTPNNGVEERVAVASDRRVCPTIWVGHTDRRRHLPSVGRYESSTKAAPEGGAEESATVPVTKGQLWVTGHAIPSRGFVASWVYSFWVTSPPFGKPPSVAKKRTIRRFEATVKQCLISFRPKVATS